MGCHNNTFDELVKVLGKKYVQNLLEVDIDEDNLEELDVFENKNSGDTKGTSTTRRRGVSSTLTSFTSPEYT